MRKKSILRLVIISITFAALGFFIAMPVEAGPQPKVTICHKFGTPAQNTLTVGYPAAISHMREHGDFLGACPQYDLFIDVDGIATPGRGLPQGINVMVGDTLTGWPTGFWIEGLDWFDNDGDCLWSFGDDLPVAAVGSGLPPLVLLVIA